MSPQRTTRLDAGMLLIGLGALALLISLFLDWYSGHGSEFGAAVAFSGWQSFELVDLVLAALALAALYAVAETLVLAGRIPPLPALVALAAGPLALLLVVVSLIDEPPLINVVSGFEPDTGVWMALAAAAVMTIGALLTRVRISLVLTSREQRDRAADPAAETQTMPGPRD